MVELLVVMAIVAVLAAVLLPVLKKAGDAGKSAKCVAQQHVIFVAMAQYMQDNNNQIVLNGINYATRWPLMIAPYIQGFEGTPNSSNIYYSGGKFFFKCPAADPAALVFTAGAVGVYGYNDLLTVGNANMPKTYAALPSPAHTVLLACNGGVSGGGLGLYPYLPGPRATQYGWKGGTDPNGASPNHGRRCNFLFADGHVDSFDIINPSAYPWVPTTSMTLKP